jgi:hypothetical protein
MKSLLLGIAGLASLASALTIAPQQQKPTVRLQIQSISMSGTGCPAGSQIIAVHGYDPQVPNSSGFTIGFDVFSGPERTDKAQLDAQLRASRNCTIQARLLYPPGTPPSR